MGLNRLNERDMDVLRGMVAPERFSVGESNLDLHSRDQSKHEPSRPEAVIWPENREEVSEIMRYANEHAIPVTAWGSGSSLEGNPIPIRGGLVLDFTNAGSRLSAGIYFIVLRCGRRSTAVRVAIP